MQLTQSIRSNSYVKGVSNDIIFTLYISCTINLVNSQIGNHLEYKSRSTYESNNIDWALLNVDTFLIKVEILWLHIKLICKLERIGGSILYVQKRNEHWIPFIYDLRMLWSPVQNFESALGITCPLVPSRFHLRVWRSIERGLGWVHANDTRRNVQMRHAGGWTRLEGDMIDGEEGWRGMRNKQTPHDYTWTAQINNKLSRLAYIVKGLMRNAEHWRSNMAGKTGKPTCGAHPSGRRSAD